MPHTRPHSIDTFLRLRVREGQVLADGMASCRLGGAQAEPALPHARWSFDGLALEASCDRMGLCPIFYRVFPDGIAVSGSLVRLIADEADEPDQPAMSAFLRLGFFLDQDTPFRSIRALPAGGRLVWNTRGLTVTGGPEVRRAEPMSFEAAVEGYIELFRDAISSRLPSGQGPALVPLSGGRDSRHILLALCAAGHAPAACVTLGQPGAVGTADQQAAAALAGALGVKQRVISPTRPYFEDALRKDVLTHLCADEHAWLMPLADELVRTATVSYDGLGGDVLSAGLFLTRRRHELFAAGRFEDLALDFFERFSPPEAALQALDRGPLGHALDRDAAVARVVEELRRHAEAANPVASFCFWNRTRREVALAPMGMMADVPVVHTPFMDEALFDFLASLPAELSLEHQLHGEVIRRGYPEHAGVPFAADLADAAPGRRAVSLATTLRSRLQGLAFARRHERLPMRQALTEALGRPARFDGLPRFFARYLRNLLALSSPPAARAALDLAGRARQRLLRQRRRVLGE